VVLSWAFPNGTNPSTASVFVAQLKPSGSSVRIQALYVLASYLLLTLGTGGAVYLSSPFAIARRLVSFQLAE